MDLQLHDKTALVTGSTAGIGLEIARRLAAEGAGLVIAGRDRAKLSAAAETLAASARRPVRAILADAGTAAGAAQLAAEAGPVDILVNNLGIYESKPFAEIGDADWLRFFEVNVMSGVRLTRALFPGMLERNWGRVIFVSSETGLVPAPDMIHYAMTKTAQLSIARGLALLTRGSKVTVNSVMPGPTRSEGIVDFLKSVSAHPENSPAELEAEFFATARQASLIQRMIEPEEIANLVAYLASPLSAATNGAAIRSEGGLITTIG